jgi:hypothetical protein
VGFEELYGSDYVKMLDMFCGTKSMSNVFKEAGHDVFTIDFDSQHSPDLCIDIMDLELDMLPWKPDYIHASPDCSCFSVASIGHHWNPDRTPKTQKCKDSIALIEKTVKFILKTNPVCYSIENPTCITRKLEIMKKLEKMGFRNTVTYCQYGDSRMKKTDFWHNIGTWHPRKACKNGDPCHVRAPRGSRTPGSTQGIGDRVGRAKIPKQLCVEMMYAIEEAMLCGYLLGANLHRS